MRPHRAALLIGLLLGLVATGIGLATPLVVKWVIDSIGTRAGLSTPVAVLLVLLVAGTIITLIQWILLGTISERVVLNARSVLVRRFLGARMAELSGRPTGELVTRVTSDTVLLREAASGAGPGLINAAIGLIGAFVLMAVLDLVLLGITVALVGVVVVLFLRLMPGIAKAETAAQEALGRVGAELEGNLRAIRTVKASRAERRQGERIVADGGRVHAPQSDRRAHRCGGLVGLLGGSQPGDPGDPRRRCRPGRCRADHRLDPGGVPAVRLPDGRADPGAGPERDGHAVRSRRGPADRRSPADGPGAVRAQSTTFVEPGESAAASSGGVLRLTGVSTGYGEGPDVLADVDLEVPRRGHVAIVGPSGAGKTTLFSLLMRFVEPRSGTIELDGRPYADWTVAEVRARFAYVEQDTPLVPGTIAENLLFTEPGADHLEIEEALRAVRLTETVSGLPDGLSTPVSSDTISGGQRQRLAIARAVVRLPEILLLDEATAQVDGLTEAAIQDCIRRAAGAGAVITIAHRLSTILDADQIIVLEAGRIRARGTHAELLGRDELYRRLVEALRIAATSETEASVPALG